MKQKLLLVSREKNDYAEAYFETMKDYESYLDTFGYTFFKDFAENYRATKIMRRGKRWYAYFGKTYVRYGE